MAKFEPALQFMLQHEGGHVTVPGDRGGETYEGISRVQHSDWEGWPLVDAGDTAGADEKVNDFYRAAYWNPLYEHIASQDVCNKIFDLTVNLGRSGGIKLVQRAARIPEDGIFGVRTLEAVNIPCCVFLQELRAQAARYYALIVKNDPSQEKFLLGWMRRAVA